MDLATLSKNLRKRLFRVINADQRQFANLNRDF